MSGKKRIARTAQRNQYDPGKVEPRVRKMWEKEKIFSPDLDASAISARKPYYNLMMFPYPSAEGMHVGNMYAFTGSDIWGRYQRMRGNDVFEPMGLDGFGIHSENYAIKTGEHPAEVAKKTQDRFYEQLHATGNAYDWTRTLETYDPDYYKWTQWLFVQMFKNGLAYREKATVNWCPSCKTVLADEQVINDHCERCNTKVELKKLEQWFLKITDYADRLLAGLDKIDWPERIKIAQRNWIGRSEGAEIEFRILNLESSIKVFTTRPDTLFGATFVVVSPELSQEWLDVGWKAPSDVREYVKQALLKRGKQNSEIETEKSGVFSGIYAINPVNQEKIPVWVADYVLAGYGTGAIMAVPAHDERDFEFAKKFKLPIRHVIRPRGSVASSSRPTSSLSLRSLDGTPSGRATPSETYTGDGEIINSSDWDGWQVPQDINKVISWLEDNNLGKKQVQYHLRDWLISRQRYWGPPIPMIYCEACAKDKKGEREDMHGWYAVPEAQLPVELPFVEDYRPRGTGESPLAQDKEWMRVSCPGCGKVARRETDVSDTFLDSSWYFLRYLATDSEEVPFPSGNSLAERGRWLPVNMYIGGAEHSVLHLMYVRFVTMALQDWGYLAFEEPFPKFYAHGLLIKDGAKMSKSKGNVVIPDEYIKKYGADTLRMYLMFLGPFDQGGDFRDTGIEGMYRFIKRVWELVVGTQDLVLVEENDSREVLQKIHQTIKRVTEDMENLRYNRAIAGGMEFLNFLQEVRARKVRHSTGIKCAEWEQALQTLVLLLAPFAPHIAEELWQKVVHVGQVDKVEQGGEASTFNSVHFQPWPTFDPELAQEEIMEIPIQVNGKLRGTIQVARDEAEKQEIVEKQAREAVEKYLVGVKKVVFVPGRLINFVI